MLRLSHHSQLDALFGRCVGAYADLTLSGYRTDLNVFAIWCEERDLGVLPAEPKTVAAFIDGQVEKYTFSTIRRRVSAIKFAHKMSDLASPVDSSDVYLSIRRAARTKHRRPKQVLGLTRDLLDKIVEGCPGTSAGFRDAALISVGYDTLCRSSELSAMRVSDVDLRSRTVFVPRSKNDQYGDGRIAGITDRTVSVLENWLKSANLSSGALFRGLHTGRPGDGYLDTSSIRRLIKGAARRAGLDYFKTAGLSGHSMRVGAAQDLMTSGFDTLAIMTAGGWKSIEVVARYVEHVRLTRARPLDQTESKASLPANAVRRAKQYGLYA